MDEKLCLSAVALIKSGLLGEKAVNCEISDYSRLFDMAKEYKLVPLIFEGLSRSETDVPSDIFEEFRKATIRVSMKGEGQLFEAEELTKLLSENGFDYMKLKGIKLKMLYPDTSLRPMGDCDILIRPNEADEIKALLKNEGYEFEQETNHELIFNKNNVLIELHKRLFPTNNRDFFAYYGDGWGIAKPASNHEYSLLPEDELAYLVTHFAKHFRDGGVGPIHLVDIYLFKKSVSINGEKLKETLNRLNLAEFYDNLCRVLECWFGTTEYDGISLLITNRLFKYGSWGTNTTFEIAAILREGADGGKKKGKFGHLINLIFPTAEYLEQRYQFLKKHKWLLPVAWVVRWFETLFFSTGRIKERKEALDNADKKTVESYSDELKAVGLGFDF